jgi:hypothetical protein
MGPESLSPERERARERSERRVRGCALELRPAGGAPQAQRHRKAQPLILRSSFTSRAFSHSGEKVFRNYLP